jgi:hypothetical protein
VEIDIVNERVSQGVAVRVRVRLSGRDTNRLFLSGDTLIQLPLDGALPDTAGSPLPRTSIFLSELAGSADGLVRVFVDEPAAAAFAAALRTSLEAALEAP